MARETDTKLAQTREPSLKRDHHGHRGKHSHLRRKNRTPGATSTHARERKDREASPSPGNQHYARIPPALRKYDTNKLQRPTPSFMHYLLLTIF